MLFTRLVLKQMVEPVYPCRYDIASVTFFASQTDVYSQFFFPDSAYNLSRTDLAGVDASLTLWGEFTISDDNIMGISVIDTFSILNPFSVSNPVFVVPSIAVSSTTTWASVSLNSYIFYSFGTDTIGSLCAPGESELIDGGVDLSPPSPPTPTNDESSSASTVALVAAIVLAVLVVALVFVK